MNEIAHMNRKQTTFIPKPYGAGVAHGYFKN